MNTLRMVEAPSQAPARPRRGGAPAPPPGEPITIGIDVARTTWAYAVHWGGAVQRQFCAPGTLEQAQAAVRAYQATHPVRVVYEACGFGYELAWWAQAATVEVVVVAPSRVERAPGPTVKTDRLDARRLATKGAAGQLRSIRIPPRREHEQRQRLRTYTHFTRDRQRTQVRLRGLLQEHGRLGPTPGRGWRAYERWLGAQTLPAPVAACVQEYRAQHAATAAAAQRVKTAVLALGTEPRFAPVVAALIVQPGVAELTAIRLLLEVGDITRFARGPAWTHSLGLTPSEYSTGAGPAHRGPIRKCGPRVLRAALLQCAWIAIRTDPSLRAVFDRLAPRIGRKKAIVAVTRRLALRLRALWLAALPPAPLA